MRQDGGAAFAATARADMTGRSGVCLAASGPGATSASTGLNNETQGATPMIPLIGRVAHPCRDRKAVRKIDCPRFLGQVAM